MSGTEREGKLAMVDKTRAAKSLSMMISQSSLSFGAPYNCKADVRLNQDSSGQCLWLYCSSNART